MYNSTPFDMISNSSVNFTYWMAGILFLYPLIRFITSFLNVALYRVAIYFIIPIIYFTAFIFFNPKFLDGLLSGLIFPSIFFVSSVIVVFISLYLKNDNK